MTLFQMYVHATSVKWNTVNGELEEAVTVYFKVFPIHFSEKMKKIRIIFNQDSRALGQQSSLNLLNTEY